MDTAVRRRSRAWLRALAALALVTLPPAAPAAAGALADAEGHLAFGFSRLFIDDAPGGSLSVVGGVDVPVTGPWRAGAELGFHLLGSRTVERGSLAAGVDYSLFEAVAMLHWSPRGRAPLGRLSAGVGLMSARGDLAASAGGAGFGDLAVEEVAPGLALEATWMPASDGPVRLGLQTGARVAFVPDEAWTVGSVRLAIFY